MWHYRHCGLRIASECAIAELDPVEADGGADVRVVIADPAPADERPAVSVSVGECRIRFPEAGEFEVRGGEEIVVHPRRSAEDLPVSLVLLGSVWAALLHQRGAFPLHAGVTADGEGAIAFCGPRGAGKSSTVAALLDRGHALVSDDLTRLEMGGEGPPLVWPSVPRLKLAPETVAERGWLPAGPGTPMPDGKLHLPHATLAGPLPLRAVYLLRWGEPGVTRLRGRAAVKGLAGAATYRPELLEPTQGLARHWGQCVRVAQHAAVYELSRPRDWTSMLPSSLRTAGPARA